MAIERIIPGTIEWQAFYANHICRYEFAKEEIIKNGAINILDAACGVGYGSFFLGSNNQLKITAIDRSKEALDIAKKDFNRNNIAYINDDCQVLLDASSNGLFDSIVSFETLEHLPKPELFISRCFELLKVGGKLIISTPNQFVSSPNGEKNWEFHEKEYTPVELNNLLSAEGFSSIQIFGQQFTPIGRFRDQIRDELYKISSNPFIRLGKKFQSIFRGHRFSALLPEQSEDFEIKEYKDIVDISNLGKRGPFVLIAVCEKL